MNPENDPLLLAREAVRQASAQARLAGLGEIVAAVAGQPGGEAPQASAALPVPAAPEEGLAALLAESLAREPDIASFTGQDGETKYHMPALLSRHYAGILDRRGDKAELIAAEVRINSRDYPRPVRLELFECPPFALAPEEISAALKAMAASEAYADIRFTQSPEGAVYLFSTRHLTREYASFLARRDEDMAGNP
ncbi:hypothetical protein NNJEOMEG_00959 [Fundidesulfovibrio magnetotacticus]|uniref:Uncharacterized protein n=1 Tax=Fundidesulfovibrio magnetotacticus TaxID=2730080 RepID=A0A6V8LSS4_9BACT|nr:hypothetical protein [Fundidesulfovibrio magnetotacticus]GFK93129.1 hypothetical protein NNJEOMEG_00959 [Fundidesulfovibrio magnetotacticus]